MKRAYVMDSTLALSLEAAKQDDIKIVPLDIIVNNETYKDLIELTGEAFYQEMENGAETTTSQPSAGSFLEIYEQLKAEGYEEVFVFTLSSGLSGTYQSATMAKDMIEGIDIYVIDTKITTAIVHLIIRDVMKMDDKSSAEIIAHVEAEFSKIDFYAYIGDFSRLKKGGRLTASQAMIGTLLKINLIFNLEGGVVNVFAKERKASNAINRIIKEIKDKKESGLILKRVVFLETNRPEFREKLEKVYDENFANEALQIEHYGLSPVLGSHTGAEVAGVIIEWE